MRSSLVLMALFASLLAAMQFGWSCVRGNEVVQLAVNTMTVKPAAWLIAHVTPEIRVRADGSHISARGGGINILSGCDGVDVVLLLVAAMLVAPIPLHRRFSGILAGSGLIYICNQARILALFYSYRTDKSLFNQLHGMIAPILLILVAAAFYVLWLDLHARGLQTSRDI